MPLWERMSVFGAVLIAILVVAPRRPLASPAATCLRRRSRARVLRRSATTVIIFVGACAKLVIPQCAVAAGILASSVVIGIVVGFAAQRTIGNFIAGLLIAISGRFGSATTPRPRADRVVESASATFIRLPTTPPVIPNEKIASDTIRNSSIRSRRSSPR